MRCNRARDLLFLYRPGELSEEVQSALVEHLASCGDCSSAWKAALAVEKQVASLRDIEPRLDDPAALTSAILHSIEITGTGKAELSWAFPEWITAPALRAAACLALLALCGTFLAQSYMDARRLAHFEERMRSLATTMSTEDPSSLRDARSLLPIGGQWPVSPVPPGSANPSTATRPNEASVIEIFRLLVKTSRPQGTTVLDYLARRHPRLAAVRLDDGIDEREREILDSEGQSLLNDVELLIRKGGKTR